MNRLPKREVPGPKSKALLELSRTVEPPCAADQVPVVWDHAERVWVTDVDGNRYIDFTSGVLVTNVGHTHPGLVQAIQKQASRLMNCYSFPTPERVTAAARLLKTLPPNLDKAVLPEHRFRSYRGGVKGCTALQRETGNCRILRGVSRTHVWCNGCGWHPGYSKTVRRTRAGRNHGALCVLLSVLL